MSGDNIEPSCRRQISPRKAQLSSVLYFMGTVMNLGEYLDQLSRI
jgi:hypothetical protein